MLAIDYDAPTEEDGRAECPEAEIVRLRVEVAQLHAVIEHLTSAVDQRPPLEESYRENEA